MFITWVYFSLKEDPKANAVDDSLKFCLSNCSYTQIDAGLIKNCKDECHKQAEERSKLQTDAINYSSWLLML